MQYTFFSSSPNLKFYQVIKLVLSEQGKIACQKIALFDRNFMACTVFVHMYTVKNGSLNWFDFFIIYSINSLHESKSVDHTVDLLTGFVNANERNNR